MLSFFHFEYYTMYSVHPFQTPYHAKTPKLIKMESLSIK